MHHPSHKNSWVTCSVSNNKPLNRSPKNSMRPGILNLNVIGQFAKIVRHVKWSYNNKWNSLNFKCSSDFLPIKRRPDNLLMIPIKISDRIFFCQPLLWEIIDLIRQWLDQREHNQREHTRIALCVANHQILLDTNLSIVPFFIHMDCAFQIRW